MTKHTGMYAGRAFVRSGAGQFQNGGKGDQFHSGLDTPGQVGDLGLTASDRRLAAGDPSSAVFLVMASRQKLYSW